MATLSEARAAGLFHPNCGHSVTPYIAGISTKPERRTPEQVQQDKELYEKKQQLRQIERKYKLWKDRQAVAITPEDTKLAKQKLKQFKSEATNYAKSNGLKTRL